MAQIKQMEIKMTTPPDDSSKFISREEASPRNFKKSLENSLIFGSGDEDEQIGIQLTPLQKHVPKFMKDINNTSKSPSETMIMFHDRSFLPSSSFQKQASDNKFSLIAADSHPHGPTMSKMKSKVSFMKLETSSMKLINLSELGNYEAKDKSSQGNNLGLPSPPKETKTENLLSVKENNETEFPTKDRKTSIMDTFASLFHGRKKELKLTSESKEGKEGKEGSQEKIGSRIYELINDKTYFAESLTKGGSTKKPKKPLPRLKQLLQKHNIVKQDVQVDFVKRILAKVRKNKKGSLSKTIECMIKSYAKLQDCLDVTWELLKSLTNPVIPDTKFKVIWDTVGAFLVLFEMLFIPFQIGFEFDIRDIMSDFETFKTVYFFLDILLMFHTAFSHEGNLIVNHKTIALCYIRHFFIYDLIASLPYPTFLTLIENSCNGDISLRFIRMIMLLRFLRLVRLGNIFSKLKDDMHSQVINSIVSLFKLLGSIIFLAHLVACAWHFIGLLTFDAYKKSWISEYEFMDKDVIDRYVASLYWTITTMITVGYGDLVAVTMIERIVNIFVMLLGCGVFGYSMNSIGILLQNINAGVSKKRQKYYIINKYMKRKHLSKETQAKAQHYLDYLFESNNEEKSEENAILAMLSDGIQEQIRKEINGRVLKENLLFQEVFGNKFLGFISNYLEEKIYSPGEEIYDENDKQLYVFFISSGSVYVTCCENKQKMFTLEKGQHFGEVSFFTGRPNDFNIVSATFSSIFFLRKKMFIEILEDYPPEKEMFHLVKDKVVLYNDLQALKIKCFACEKSDHQITTCPTLHYMPSKTRLIAAKLNEEASIMRIYKRKKRIRYHALVQRKQTEAKSETFRDKQIENNFGYDEKQGNRIEDENDILENKLAMSRENRRSTRFSTKRKTAKVVPDKSLDDMELPGNPDGYFILANNRNPRVIKMTTVAERSLGDIEYQVNSVGYPLCKTYWSPTALNEEDEIAFDNVRNFQIYFPHNNIKKIIDAINRENLKKIKRKEKEAKSHVQVSKGDSSKPLVVKPHRGSLQIEVQSKDRYRSFLFGDNNPMVLRQKFSDIASHRKELVLPEVFEIEPLRPRSQEPSKNKIDDDIKKSLKSSSSKRGKSESFSDED